jgi:hypothetical protein
MMPRHFTSNLEKQSSKDSASTSNFEGTLSNFFNKNIKKAMENSENKFYQ